MNEPKEPIRNRIKKYIANHEVNNKVKTHFEKHKMKYAVGGTIVVTTVANWAYFANKRKHEMAALATLSVASYNTGGHHNTINNVENLNVFYKRVSKYGNPLGRPGVEILDLDTGHTYDSIQRAMADLETTPYTIRQHLYGNLPDINGHRLMRVDDYFKQHLGYTPSYGG